MGPTLIAVLLFAWCAGAFGQDAQRNPNPPAPEKQDETVVLPGTPATKNQSQQPSASNPSLANPKSAPARKPRTLLWALLGITAGLGAGGGYLLSHDGA